MQDTQTTTEAATSSQLRAIRQERGVTLMGIMALSGVSTATLVGIEKHGFLPRETTRERIAQALGCTVDEIWPALAAHSENLAT